MTKSKNSKGSGDRSLILDDYCAAGRSVNIKYDLVALRILMRLFLLLTVLSDMKCEAFFSFFKDIALGTQDKAVIPYHI